MAVSPRRPSGASTTLSCTEEGNSTWTGSAFRVENFDRQILDEIILRVREQILLQRDRFVGLRVHEMVAAVVLVAELQRASG